ncbi:MAG: DNA polymerase III subunit beta [Deferrisomatales bacterium]
MLIRIPQESFKSLLARAQSVLERKSTRPILEHVLLEAFGDGLRVAATDLRVSLTQKAACQVERPGSISVPGRKIHEIARELPGEEITLEVNEKQWVTVSAGNTVFHLPGAPAEEYPSLPAEPDTFLTMDPAVFRKMLDKTLFAASSDESRIYLCGVFVKAWTDEEGQQKLRMVATDGHRLSLVDRPVPQDLAVFREGVIVPKKGLIELKSLLESRQDPFELASDRGQLFTRVDSTCLTVTLIDASFPNYEQVIPTDQGVDLHFDRLQLMDAVRRVSLLSDEETHSVVLEVSGPAAVLRSTNAQMGDAREEVPVTWEGEEEPTRLAFNAAYVIDTLRAIDGADVVVSVSEPLAPCLFRAPADPGYLGVVMPMRID